MIASRRRGVNALLFALLFALLAFPAIADPTGASILSNATETIDPAAAAASATVGGSFTKLLLNATTQTPRWKAYVGNVTSSFVLNDADNATIYDWGQAALDGEVYASRSGAINWSTIGCANDTAIAAEESALNHSATAVDSISATFNESVHATFWVGASRISNSSCYAIATYVDSAAQATSESADFQEILLMDNTLTLVWTAIVQQDTLGYANATLDFQMIVPEDEYAGTPHTYYFWLELG